MGQSPKGSRRPFSPVLVVMMVVVLLGPEKKAQRYYKVGPYQL